MKNQILLSSFFLFIFPQFLNQKNSYKNPPTIRIFYLVSFVSLDFEWKYV